MSSIVEASDGSAMRKLETRAMVKAHLHELQNHLHLATMEVELVQLEVTERLDCLKLLNILTAFKQSLDKLRDQLLAPSESDVQPG